MKEIELTKVDILPYTKELIETLGTELEGIVELEYITKEELKKRYPAAETVHEINKLTREYYDGKK